MIQFNRLNNPAEGSLFRGGASFTGGQNTGNLNSMAPFNADITTPLPFSGNSGVILLPKKPGEESYDICKIYELNCSSAGQAAVRPYMEKGLLRPNPHPSKVLDPQEAPMEMATGNFETQPSGGTTAQGALFAAQQISRAREYIRQEKYDQALNCYQTARTIDSKNTNFLVGIIFCYIMTGKYQAGGVCVSHLSEENPDFWRQEADFTAVFGVPGPEIAKRMDGAEPELDRLLSLYQAKDSKKIAEEMKQEYLSKLFLAWLRGDREGVKAQITAAAEAAPLDPPVQQLYYRITGKEKQEELKLTPIKPLG